MKIIPWLLAVAGIGGTILFWRKSEKYKTLAKSYYNAIGQGLPNTSPVMNPTPEIANVAGTSFYDPARDPANDPTNWKVN